MGENSPHPLPPPMGGLGLLHLLDQGKALRLKYLHDVTNKHLHKTKNWTAFARYWLRQLLYDINKNGPAGWPHLRDETAPQYQYRTATRPHLPLHYNDLMETVIPHIKAIASDKFKTTKSSYTIIRDAEWKAVDLSYIRTHWHDLFNHRLNINTQINWECLWTHPFNSYNVGTTHDTLYKLIHNRLQTRVMTKHRRQNYDINCPICKRTPESAIHAVVQCPEFARKIWERFEDNFVKLLPNVRYIFEAAALTINVAYPHKTKQSKLTAKLSRTLSEIILHEIWTSRCKHDHNEQTVNVDRSIKSINTKLKFLIKTHYREHADEDDIPTFREKFCINNALCNIDYHMQLNLFFPP